MKPKINKDQLEGLYYKYNRREYVHPDPLEFLYNYENPLDKEIVGLIASSLAYGRVQQILKSVSSVLSMMKPSPLSFLVNTKDKDIIILLSNFKHRFTTGREMAALLIAIRHIIGRYGSIQACFESSLNTKEETIIPALTSFVKKISDMAKNLIPTLLPQPSKGSACKRLNLFLRWMVRSDEVDPGGWNNTLQSKLIVPLDTHMHKIGLALNLTRRKQADLKTALEISDAFSNFSPTDPIKYDFALTRLGIRREIDRDRTIEALIG